MNVMAKKPEASVLRLVVLAAAVLAVAGRGYLAHTRAPTPGAPSHTGPSTLTSAASTPSPGSASVDAETSGDAPLAQLHGSDFTVTVSDNGNELYKNLAVELNNGTSIAEILRLSGDKEKLANELYSQGDQFELAHLLPDAAREQLVVNGSSLLPDGNGTLGTFAVYRIDDTVLTELFNVVTERNVDAIEGTPPRSLQRDRHARNARRKSHDRLPLHRRQGASPDHRVRMEWPHVRRPVRSISERR